MLAFGSMARLSFYVVANRERELLSLTIGVEHGLAPNAFFLWDCLMIVYVVTTLAQTEPIERDATQCRYYPTRKRLLRYWESVMVTGAMLAVALLFMICSLNLQVKATSSSI